MQKNHLSLLQESLKSTQQKEDLSAQYEEKFNNLQKQLEQRDNLITELKAGQQPQPITPKGPMSDLIEDLQNKINKLKLAIEEKNKIIEDLKSS